MSSTKGKLPIAARIDTRGQDAAWSILCAERAVAELRPGQVLEVSLDDPQLAIDLPRILSRRGEVMLATQQGAGGLRIYVRRGAYQTDLKTIT